MDFSVSDEQSELVGAVRAVLNRECPISFVRDTVERGTSPVPLWRQMADLGWPGMTLPTSLGGLGLGYVELGLILEELGRHVCPGPYLATVTQFAATVEEVATDPLRERLLRDVAAGTLTGSLAVAEDAGSWSVDDVGLTARPSG